MGAWVDRSYIIIFFHRKSTLGHMFRQSIRIAGSLMSSGRHLFPYGEGPSRHPHMLALGPHILQTHTVPWISPSLHSGLCSYVSTQTGPLDHSVQSSILSQHVHLSLHNTTSHMVICSLSVSPTRYQLHVSKDLPVLLMAMPQCLEQCLVYREELNQ